MISELVMIEQYFGRLEAVMTLEDLIRTYGPDKVKDALAEDRLELRATFSQVYGRLTDKGRNSLDDAPVPAL